MSVTARPKVWVRPDPHSGNMPAWKREVLERKRAKKQGVPVGTPGRDGSPHRRRSDRGRSSGRKSSPAAGMSARAPSPGAAGKSVRAPSPGATVKSMRAPSPGAAKPVRAPSPGATVKSVRAPSPGAAKPVRAPSPGATVKSVRAPSPGATVKSVRAPSPGAVKSVRAPSPGAVKSVRAPSPGAVKSVRAPSPGAAKPVRASSSSLGKSTSVKRRSDDGERLVLQESLGPLHENPFIRLEQERRRNKPREPSPAPTLLEMYSNVPGIRTIRADHIIIIESDPGYFSGTKKQEPHMDTVEALMAKSGSKVAAIRASEVVIYETEEPRPQNVEKEHNEVVEEAGRVSRLLEKFGHDHSRPPRSRSWDNILDRRSSPSRDDSNKMPDLPNQTAPLRHSQATVNKAPKRYGEISPLSTSFSEESKRFPLNDPSWLPSKPSPVVSLPSILYKKPSSPTTSPVTSPALSSSTFGLRYETSTDEKVVSPSVATFRERFEAGSTADNLPLPKALNPQKKTGNNTFVVNPKAASHTKGKPETIGVQPKDVPVLTNGYIDHPDEKTKPKGQVSVQDLLSKTKHSRTSLAGRSSEEHRQVPSASVSTNHISKADNSRRPKSEPDIFNSNSLKSSATKSETTVPDHFKPTLSSATPNQQKKVSSSTSSNRSFEIRPAVKPDPSSIPDGDIQAKALANIRMQSKNSFVFIPKKTNPPVSNQGHEVQKVSKEKPKVNAPTTNGPKLDNRDFPIDSGILSNGLPPSQTLQKNTAYDTDSEPEVDSLTQKASSVPSLSDFDWQSGLLPSHSSTEGHSFTDKGSELEYLSSIHQNNKGPLSVTHIQDDYLKPEIPITNIDDIVNSDIMDGNVQANVAVNGNESPLPSYRPHAPLSSSVHNKSGNTFTIVPKRKPVIEQEPVRTPVLKEEEDEDASSKRTETPYSEIGAMLKKRYPTVDEIQVVGGYQSLSKSCLSANGSSRKKMKITFNEKNIHKIFEYPSENSLADDTGEEDAYEGSGSEYEEEEKLNDHFFPRAKFPIPGNAHNSGLSDYTAQQYGTAAPQHGKALGDDTLSPDESSKLALYF
ncbi:taperin [Xenopus laevis]|uniref:Taperin n=2 Tax=Xenopus laevis TaxID=8355 RepID=A0A1L8F5M4_XENLA|nr:taperin [Xenopus laevis]OCT66877.1 hypothetical protein XELAEV_18038159mg [Xenopus laevis]